MREIKFRAWNKKEKKYVNAEDYYICLNGESTIYCNKYNDYKPDSTLSELIYEQFTGLTDNNGVEIFVGDLRDHCYYGVGVVKFGKYLCSNSDEYYYGYYVEYSDNRSFTLSGGLEIIGNIHENKELLK